jgi:para-aminobenzoate synthetase/4-amino-4-deoxychorismate lyase
MQAAETGTAEYGVGGGITWDSAAAAEYDEVVAKARILSERRPSFRLLETLLHEPSSGYRRLAEHLDRLGGSAAYHGFMLNRDAVAAALEREAGRFPDRASRVRLLVDRRGLVESGAAPMPRSPEPLRLAIDEGHPVDAADPSLFHKTTLRDRYEAAAARFPAADDVVLVNRDGHATETTVANLAVELDGRWWTPPIGDGLLPGCERAALLADGELAERSITVEELRAATGLAVLSSVRGWRTAVLVDASPAGDPTQSGSVSAARSGGNAKGRIVEASRGQSHSGQRGGSS